MFKVGDYLWYRFDDDYKKVVILTITYINGKQCGGRNVLTKLPFNNIPIDHIMTYCIIMSELDKVLYV